MKRKLVSVLLCVSMVAAMTAGCGSDKKAETEATTPAATEAQKTEAPDTEAPRYRCSGNGGTRW